MFCQEFNNNLKDRTNFINETFLKLMKEQEGEKKDKGNEHNNSDDDSNADEKDVIKDDQGTPGRKVTLLSLNVCFLALLFFFGSVRLFLWVSIWVSVSGNDTWIESLLCICTFVSCVYGVNV